MTAFAPPAEAHARVAYALAEVRKYLIPDSNDEIRQKQVSIRVTLSNLCKMGWPLRCLIHKSHAHTKHIFTQYCCYTYELKVDVLGTGPIIPIPFLRFVFNCI